MVSYLRQHKRSADIHSNIESRVTAVETAVDHIESSMYDIKTSLDAGLSSIHDRIDDQSDSSKPNVVAWAGWAAVILLVIGMFGSGYVRDLNRIETEVDAINANRISKFDDTQTQAIGINSQNLEHEHDLIEEMQKEMTKQAREITRNTTILNLYSGRIQ